MDHHPRGPSTLERGFNCPGSYRMEKMYGEECEDNVGIRDEGTMLHKCVETGSLEGLTIEQAETSTACLEFLSQIAPVKSWGFESRVEISDRDGNPLTFGTADASFVEFDTGTVVDWKFGHDPVLHCADHYAVKAYALGLMQSHNLDLVRGYIFQPRLQAQSESVWTRSELLQYADEIKDLYTKADEPGMVLCAGSHCKYCKAKFSCPENRAHISEAITKPVAGQLSGENILKALVTASLAEKFISRIKQEARSRLLAGADVPGYYMQNRRGKSYCKDANAAYSDFVVNGPLTHDEFMEFVDLQITKLTDLYAGKMKIQNGDSLKQSKEFIQSRDWFGRKSDSVVLAKAREHKRKELDNA